MKVRNFAIAAMAAVASIDASARGSDTPAVNATHDGLGLSAHVEEGMLGPEYKSIGDFVPFRARLLHDGWSPVSESMCMEELTGVDTEDTCLHTPDSLNCHICSKVPEMFLSTGNGHHFMRYRKASRQLDVAVYGDFQDLDFPGQFGLVITGWTVLDAVSGEKLESVVTMRTAPW